MRLLKSCLMLLVLLSFNTMANISVIDPKARATFALAKTGAAYMTLVNDSDKPDVLKRVTVAPDVAQMVEIHTVLMDGEMMQMRELEDGLPLPANDSVTLKPGGFHLMVMGLAGPLEAGKSISLTLHFANAKPQIVSVPIVKM